MRAWVSGRWQVDGPGAGRPRGMAATGTGGFGEGGAEGQSAASQSLDVQGWCGLWHWPLISTARPLINVRTLPGRGGSDRGAAPAVADTSAGPGAPASAPAGAAAGVAGATAAGASAVSGARAAGEEVPATAAAARPGSPVADACVSGHPGARAPVPEWAAAGRVAGAAGAAAGGASAAAAGAGAAGVAATAGGASTAAAAAEAAAAETTAAADPAKQDARLGRVCRCISWTGPRPMR